jgi:XTP/dITP diphosphohydrolase
MTRASQSPPDVTPAIVLGTANRNKAAELIDLLVPLGLRIETLADVREPLAIEETGQSFAENAAIKATRQATHLARWVLGDDSGLVVDALGGAPGVRSARFAGPNATDEDNRQRLLAELADIGPERRTAHFVCHLALADPAGKLRAQSEGRCHGRIRLEPCGTLGFGYDSLFEVIEYHRTFGQLASEVKACLSHRARAVYALAPQIEALFDAGEWGGRG